MKDLQEIESGFQNNNEMNRSDSFNLGEEDNFDVDCFNNSNEFDLGQEDNGELEIQEKQKDLKTGKDEILTESAATSNGDRSTAIVQVLENLTEVDTEVQTSVPMKMLSFIEQYGQLKQWKIVKIYNYVLLKIPESSEQVVEFVLKFDEVDNNKYAIKYLKYDEMSFEQFHSVGSFILDLISPYC